MASTEEKREMGASLMFTGLAVWVADLLVVFFLPAGIRLGGQPAFFAIIFALAVFGLVLMGFGYNCRRKSATAE